MKQGQNPRLTYAIQYFDKTGEMRAPYQICKGFVAAGWDVAILTIATANNLPVERVWESVAVKKVAGTGKRRKLIKMAGRLIKKRRQHLILTTVWEWQNFALLLANLLFGSPYAVRLDTFCYLAVTGFWKKARERLRYGLTLGQASLIIAETPESYACAARRFSVDQVILAPSCLWLGELQAIEKKWSAKGFSPPREPVILSTSRLIERKRVHDLIQAFSLISDAFPQWRLEFRGPKTDSDYFGSLRQLVVRLGLGERVQFLPGLSGELLYQRYRETAVYALPSEGEGMPSTVLEAMYFGGAIVAGKSGGVSYMLDQGKCGRLHAPGDIQALSGHLMDLMSSAPLRHEYMMAARGRMEKIFVWEAYFPNLEDRFKKIIKLA